MKRLSLLLVLLVTMAAQGQTLHTCGTKPNQIPCLSVNSCVYSPSTGKKYCGATMAAAEAQEMAHEGICTVLDASRCVGGGAYPPTVALDHVVIQKDIRYCDDLNDSDPSECVMHSGEAKAHREAEMNLEQIGLKAIDDLGTCETRMDFVHKMALQMQKTLRDVKPLDDCDPGTHWVEKEHDKWGSAWVCEKDKP